jgi:hypothetical protein
MRFLFNNIFGAIIRWLVITAIGIFLAAYQLSPQGVVEALLNNPPEWTTNPLVRLAALLLGSAIVTLLVFWERLFATPLDRSRRVLVNRAFSDLPGEARDWLIHNYAGGRAPEAFAEALNTCHLIDRDFVGWTGIRPELQPFVAAKINAYKSLFARVSRKVARMTPYAIVITCLIISIVSTGVAVFVLVRQHQTTKIASAQSLNASELNQAPQQQATPQATNAASAPAQPLKPQPRIYSDRTVGELMTFYEGRTPFQAETLMEPYKGKWIGVEGKVINLLADSQPGHSIAVLASGRFVIECRLDGRSEAVVSRTNKGDVMNVEGKIGSYQNGSQLYLADCEIVPDKK